MKSAHMSIARLLGLLWAGIMCCGLLLGPSPLQAQNVSEAVAAIDECVQKLDKNQLPAPVAKALQLDQAFVEKALLQANCQVSDLVFIKVLASKTAASCEAVLASHPQREWLPSLKKAGLSEEDILQLLDDAYADLALKMLDFPKKKENVKKTAKR